LTSDCSFAIIIYVTGVYTSLEGVFHTGPKEAARISMPLGAFLDMPVVNEVLGSVKR
jgi:hypothetical protein